MLYYAANISQLFRDSPLAERFRRVAEAGFASYELLFPQRENLAEVLDLQRRHGLQLDLFDLEVATPPQGYVLSPDEAGFFARLDEAVSLAHRLGCRRLNALVGPARSDLTIDAQVDLLVNRLRRAGTRVAGEGITLLVEALNPHDNPGVFLTTSRVGFQVVELVGLPNVRFQYDYYHMQIVEGNLIDTVRRNVGLIGHVQIAEVPGRHEPGTGEIDYLNVLAALAATGYDGYVGLEYTASSPTADPFAWLPRGERERRMA